MLQLHRQSPTTLLDNCIAEIAAGNKQALSILYEYTQSDVYAFALSTLKNSHDAEDVLHDCFVSIWNNAGSYRSQSKPMAWILTITKNLCLKILRGRAKSTQLDMEDWREHLDCGTEMTADDKVIIEECMSCLSEEERQIVVLHAVSGFKHREIAKLLDLALPTVLSKYRRTIKKLKEHLKEEGVEYHERYGS